ncbi:LuxR C-terminal-related transcriptional regulator [Sphaerisporangium flaviroseum]|uniref:LuxR C-terminal-related transcriptional regulator n=1 Tax=Sphaerisporangium flaviroseum TaxID=509199 RepID=A0ABP7IIP9_9ACTN
MRRWPLIGREAELTRIVGLLRDPGCPAVVLAGPAGAGKTRLVAESASGFAETHAVVWVHATQAARTLPLGAMAPLLPAAAPGPRANLLAWAMDAIVGSAGGRPIVLVADDAHLLDPASAALVHHLTRQATVLATLRTGESCPDPVTALWRQDSAERIDLTPLDRDGTAALVAQALPGVVAPSLVDQLHHLSEGNLLYLSELVAAAVRRDDGDVWRLRRELLRHASRLTDLVQQRMGTVDEQERAVIELVALGEPVDLPELIPLTGAEPVERAEARGLISLGSSGRRVLARLGHPLYGEIVRTRMPSLRMRRHYRDLAEALERGGPHPEDITRIALWRLESDTVSDPAPLVEACRLAWVAHDYPLALRLGHGAWEHGGGVDAAILLATLLNYTERSQEAEDILARVWDEPCDERRRTELVLSRAWSLGFGLGRVAEAKEILDQALETVTGPTFRQDLTVLLMILASMIGDFPAAMRIGTDLLADPSSTPPVRAQALSTYAACGLYTGRYDESVASARRALADADSWRHAVPVITVGLHMNWCAAAQAKGDLVAAEEAIVSLETAMAGPADWDRATDTLSLLRGQLALMRGLPREAARLLHGVVAPELEDRASTMGLTPARQAVYSLARAMLGDGPGAEAAVTAAKRAADRLPEISASLGYGFIGLAYPWAAAAAGELAHAVEYAAESAALSRGRPSFETLALHTAVRLGAPGPVAERLAELATLQDGPFAGLCADHARAALQDDGPGLAEVSRRFEALGMILHATEAAAQASRAHASAGRAASARAAAARAWALGRRCEGARTPALERLSAPGLTAREYEIARLAAGGLANREIAARLVVSERTVENHLRAVYAKLGAGGRTDLGPLLGDE